MGDVKGLIGPERGLTGQRAGAAKPAAAGSKSLRVGSELPVNHRPRRFGTSHDGIRNHAWTASEDLLAVRWMQDRWLRYEAIEEL